MSDTVDALMPEPVRRIEIFTGSGRRRKWLSEEKAAILEECDLDGETVCGVARRHGLTASQVFWWRRQAREAAKADCGGRRNEGGFVPVAVEPESSTQDGGIEIAVGGAVVRIRRETDGRLLGAVLRILKACPA